MARKLLTTNYQIMVILNYSLKYKRIEDLTNDLRYLNCKTREVKIMVKLC